MPSVSVKMTAQQFARLERVARERRVPKAQILREAFDQGKAKEAPPSAFDLVADLAGTADGPRDASTNAKYLDDLGLPGRQRRKSRVVS